MRFYIQNNRQKRALKALIEKDAITVKDMGPTIGSLNPRQTIMELRRLGFDRIILTRRFTVEDMDGKKCQPGEYYIPSEWKIIAKKVLEYTTLKQQTSKAACEISDSDVTEEKNNDSTH